MPSRALTLVASDVAPSGGMERVAYELCVRLLERGWSVTVIARSCALPAGPRLRFVRILAPSRPVSVALALSWLHGSALVRRHHRGGVLQTNNPVLAGRVDVVHAHFCERAYRARVGGSRARRASVAFRLNSWIAAGLELAAERWSYRPGRSRRVVAVSAGLAREIAEHYPHVAADVRTIPNGVDATEFGRHDGERDAHRARLGVGDEEHLAIFVGGDWHRKGLRAAIEGVAAAPGWHLAVLGPGDAEAFARYAGDGRDRVHFLGVERPHGWYAAADALTQPSAYEAFSLVSLEAAAAGLPLVVPRINGNDELVRDGVTGWFTPAEGPAVATRLRELSGDPGLRERMGAAARARAADYDWSRVVDAFEALYAEL